VIAQKETEILKKLGWDVLAAQMILELGFAES